MRTKNAKAEGTAKAPLISLEARPLAKHLFLPLNKEERIDNDKENDERHLIRLAVSC